MGDQTGPHSEELSFAFVDLAGFTALTDVHGDAEAAALVSGFVARAQESQVGTARVVKSMGDAVMYVAATPADAICTVLELAKACANQVHHPVVRAGVHHGPVVRMGDDFVGGTVNVAARLASQARAGHLLTLAELGPELKARGLQPHELPGQRLRHVSAVFDLLEVDLDGDDEVAVDPVCQMRVHPTEAAASLRERERVLFFCSSECLDRYLHGSSAHHGHSGH